MVKDILHGIINADGTMQLDSNDGELRILLKHTNIFNEEKQLEVFSTVLYVKDDFEWQQTNNSVNYQSADEFLEVIKKSDDFTLAVRDIEQQRKGERIGG